MTREAPCAPLWRRVVLPAAACAAAVAMALGTGAAVRGQVFRSGVDLVSFGVTVIDRKGELVTSLGRDDFEVYEDGQRQTLLHFARGDEDASAPPLHLGLVFDTSGSMDEDIQLSRTAAVRFLNTLQRAVDVTLVDFDTEVRVARYGQNDFARLVERIRKRRPDGMTAFYDAIGVYLDGASTLDGRRILVLYTDGGDNTSALSYSGIQDLIKASDITIYAVGFLSHLSQSYQMDQRMKIRQLAEMTGGQAFFPMAIKDIESSYDKVLAEIRGQYTLGYLSTNGKTDGSWRKVEIKVTRPGSRTRSRRGYYAPYRKQP
jgi:Ca-activated chloride channel family protein